LFSFGSRHLPYTNLNEGRSGMLQVGSDFICHIIKHLKNTQPWSKNYIFNPSFIAQIVRSHSRWKMTSLRKGGADRQFAA